MSFEMHQKYVTIAWQFLLCSFKAMHIGIANWIYTFYNCTEYNE